MPTRFTVGFDVAVRACARVHVHVTGAGGVIRARDAVTLVDF